jgi:hypothetical protein
MAALVEPVPAIPPPHGVAFADAGRMAAEKWQRGSLALAK